MFSMCQGAEDGKFDMAMFPKVTNLRLWPKIDGPSLDGSKRSKKMPACTVHGCIMLHP